MWENGENDKRKPRVCCSFSGRTSVQLKEEDIPRTVDWSRKHAGFLQPSLRLESSGWVVSATRTVEAAIERNTGNQLSGSGKNCFIF